MWPAETVSFHISAPKIYDFSNRTPGVSVWSLGFCGGNQETVEFPVPCGLGAGRQCSPYMFLALRHLKKNKKTNGWATVSRSAGGGELCLCLTSMHLRLEEAHHTDFLWHPKKRSSGSFLPSPHWCFPLQLECKDLQPHQTAAPPTLPCTPTRVCKRMLSFIWNVQFKRFLLMSLCSCDGETADPSDFSDRQLSLSLCNLMPHQIFVTLNLHYPFLFLMGLKSGDLVHKSPHVFVPSYFRLSWNCFSCDSFDLLSFFVLFCFFVS